MQTQTHTLYLCLYICSQHNPQVLHLPVLPLATITNNINIIHYMPEVVLSLTVSTAFHPRPSGLTSTINPDLDFFLGVLVEFMYFVFYSHTRLHDYIGWLT